jgi:hypothetical protein
VDPTEVTRQLSRYCGHRVLLGGERFVVSSTASLSGPVSLCAEFCLLRDDGEDNWPWPPNLHFGPDGQLFHVLPYSGKLVYQQTDLDIRDIYFPDSSPPGDEQ